MDPPYNKGMIKPTLINLHDSGYLAKDACIIVEHTPFEPVQEGCRQFELTTQRKYGKTLISFIKLKD